MKIWGTLMYQVQSRVMEFNDGFSFVWKTILLSSVWST